MTQPFQIGTEVVATLADVSVVGTSEIDLDLSAIFNVAGDVTISDNDQLVSIDLSHLLSVGGNFTLTDNGALLTISLPSLNDSVSVDGDTSARCQSGRRITWVDAISGDTSPTDVSLSTVSTANVNVSIDDDASHQCRPRQPRYRGRECRYLQRSHRQTDVNLGNLSTANDSVSIDGDTSAINVNLGSLTTVSGERRCLRRRNIGDRCQSRQPHHSHRQRKRRPTTRPLATLDMGNLSTVTGSVNFSDNASLVTIDLSALLQAGAIVISDNGVVTLDLSALVHAGGDVSITDNTHLLTVDLPQPRQR